MVGVKTASMIRNQASFLMVHFHLLKVVWSEPVPLLSTRTSPLRKFTASMLTELNCSCRKRISVSRLTVQTFSARNGSLKAVFKRKRFAALFCRDNKLLLLGIKPTPLKGGKGMVDQLTDSI